ncbi:hypothetical protein T440DRAFT_73473 [Plenodomus tracheiphilus IPT5]|uniref:4Fe-4S ferredoxin-type domain-containing protein n=1 Tax=Plenodomus tracheiphilus IPT5 TaxID=1408161 RepID=A0A6A7ALX8_9PLEO|nr:hypothetical protein T440DRAFT_73455 [Plenodomus tracheiphilus IPT5]KAF2843963.1 hypothetical protein T440DRAFT_73473 [Plenodomus tracheiphilus IPT5]
MVRVFLTFVLLTTTLAPASAWISKAQCCAGKQCFDCIYNGKASDSGHDAVCGPSCVSWQKNTDIGYTCFGCLSSCPASRRLTAGSKGKC